MRIKLSFFVIFLSLILGGCSNSQTKDVNITSGTSCYEQYSIKAANSNPLRQAFIVVDQTTLFNENLKKNLLEKIQPLFTSGSKITLVKFSTFTDKYYTTVVKETFVDTPLSQEVEDDTPIGKVKKFKKCIKSQSDDIAITIPKTISSTLDDSNSSIEKSEVLKALKDLAESKIQKSKANDKIILIASDMLENSSATSFYSNNNIRTINPTAELAKVKKAGLFSDFSGAKVYVIGAGLVANNSKTSRSIASIEALKEFWRQYFKASNASLVGFGTPELMEEIEIEK